jgi:hypothetical protein
MTIYVYKMLTLAVSSLCMLAIIRDGSNYEQEQNVAAMNNSVKYARMGIF